MERACIEPSGKDGGLSRQLSESYKEIEKKQCLKLKSHRHGRAF
jgi:hypothetical protein